MTELFTIDPQAKIENVGNGILYHGEVFTWEFLSQRHNAQSHVIDAAVKTGAITTKEAEELKRGHIIKMKRE